MLAVWDKKHQTFPFEEDVWQHKADIPCLLQGKTECFL